MTQIVMFKNTSNALTGFGPFKQRGMVATMIAVIVLLATLLASLALLTSTDTGNLIAGNLSFKQAIVQEAERAYADAQANIAFTGVASESDNIGIGFYSSIQTASAVPLVDVPALLNPATTRCPNIAGTKAMPLLSTGNQVCYIVERLCNASGTASPPGPTAAANPCIIPGATFSAGTHGSRDDTGASLPAGVLPAFRLTVRVDGPKNTSGFVQTILR